MASRVELVLACLLVFLGVANADAVSILLRRVKVARSSSTEAAVTGVFPADCARVFPTPAHWREITNWPTRARHAQTTTMDTLLTNAAPLRFSSVLKATVAAWNGDDFLSYNEHIRPRQQEYMAFRRFQTCMEQYFAGTVHPAFVRNPAGFLSANFPVIGSAPFIPETVGVGQAWQRIPGAAPGAVQYGVCDYTLDFNGLNGACQPANANGLIPLLHFAAPAAATVAQVWIKHGDRGAAWFHAHPSATEVKGIVIRVVPAANYATSPLGGVPSNFLPWKQNCCTYTTLTADATTAFTSALSGCQIYVATHARQRPILIHCNAAAIPGTPNDKAQAMDTGASEIVRLNAGYRKSKKLTTAMYRPPQWMVTPYGTRGRGGAWSWRVAIVERVAPYRHRSLAFIDVCTLTPPCLSSYAHVRFCSPSLRSGVKPSPYRTGIAHPPCDSQIILSLRLLGLLFSSHSSVLHRFRSLFRSILISFLHRLQFVSLCCASLSTAHSINHPPQ